MSFALLCTVVARTSGQVAGSFGREVQFIGRLHLPQDEEGILLFTITQGAFVKFAVEGFGATIVGVAANRIYGFVHR